MPTELLNGRDINQMQVDDLKQQSVLRKSQMSMTLPPEVQAQMEAMGAEHMVFCDGCRVSNIRRSPLTNK